MDRAASSRSELAGLDLWPLSSTMTKIGSSSLSVQGRKFKRQHPRSKQLDACSAIHSPLERL